MKAKLNSSMCKLYEGTLAKPKSAFDAGSKDKALQRMQNYFLRGERLRGGVGWTHRTG